MKASVLLLLVVAMAIGVTLPALAQAEQPGAPAHRGAIALGAAEPEGSEGEGEGAEEPQAAEEGQEGAEGQEENEEEGGTTAGGSQGRHGSHGGGRRHSSGKQSRRKANAGGHGKHRPSVRRRGKRTARSSTRGATR